MDGCLIAVFVGSLGMLWVVLSVAITLGFVIFVHELGHFLAAKACGVKCEKFYIGFDVPIKIGPLALPAALCRFRWGETEYGIGILPLGGYVKMLGQDDNPANQAKENERIRLRQAGEPAAAAATGDSAATAASAEPGPAPQSAADSATAAPATAAPAASAEGTTTFVLDPRSFPARPVWQRMIIISAGVVMNLIFAVVFGAVAYRMGVRYQPCVVGEAVPASPAWVAGLQPGDKILQIGRRGEPNPQLRFREELMPHVVLNGGADPLDLLVERTSSEEPQWLSIQPVDRYRTAREAAAREPAKGVLAGLAEWGKSLFGWKSNPLVPSLRETVAQLPKSPTLGVVPAGTTRLMPGMPVEDYRFTDPEYAELQGGDEIIAIEGQPLPRDPQTGQIMAASAEAILALRMTEPLRVTFRRPPQLDAAGRETAPAKEFDAQLPACPLRTLGIAMELGPVVSVRQDGPADRAGIRVGDVLASVAGEPLDDPLTLPQRLLPRIGQEIDVGLRRAGQGDVQTVRLVPVQPSTLGEFRDVGSPLALEALGLCCRVENRIAAVDPQGPAARAGLLQGDEVVALRFVISDPQQREKAAGLFGPRIEQSIRLDPALPNWCYAHSILQHVLPGTVVQLVVVRGSGDAPQDAAASQDPATSAAAAGSNGEIAGTGRDGRPWRVFDVTPVEADPGTWYYPARGLNLGSLSRVRTADTWGQAWSLGLQETWHSVTQVLQVLHGLLTGKISWGNLGGPITIARAAGYQASEGLAQLLIFLTLLSANLAVLNFLPIPALDGGHMVFLVAEGVRGKPVDERLQIALTVMGVVLLLGLILVLSIKDVGDLLLG